MEAVFEKINEILNDIGFSQSNIEHTHVLWSSLAQVIDLYKYDCLSSYLDISGSWMEGLAPLLVKCEMSTDIDVMAIVRDWNESGKDVENFRMISETRNPGFVKLEVVNVPDDMEDNPIVKKENKEYLGSPPMQYLFKIAGMYFIQNFSKVDHEANIISEFRGVGVELDLQKTRHDGPAYAIHLKRTFSLFGGAAIKKMDLVVALWYPIWPEVAFEWIQRERKHNWPPKELIEKCVNKGCLLVPIGCKLEKCPEEDLEWRVSFNSAVTQLFWSLDPIQYKCFAILKLILHYIIKPRLDGDEITSFIMKTSLLWYLEENGNVWDSTDLLSYVQDCLSKVCSWVEDDFCPDYFIPEHNLLRGRYNEEQQLNILAVLYQILDEYPRCFLQIPLFLESVGREIKMMCPNTETFTYTEEEKSERDIEIGKYSENKKEIALKSDFIAPTCMSYIFQELITYTLVSSVNEDHASGRSFIGKKIDTFLKAYSYEKPVVRYIKTKRLGLQISLGSFDAAEPGSILQDLVSRVEDMVNKAGYNVEPAPLSMLANIYFHASFTEKALDILNDLIGNYRACGYPKLLGFVANIKGTDSDFQSKVKKLQDVDVGTDIVYILNHQFSLSERKILPTTLQVTISCNALKNKDSDFFEKITTTCQIHRVFRQLRLPSTADLGRSTCVCKFFAVPMLSSSRR